MQYQKNQRFTPASFQRGGRSSVNFESVKTVSSSEVCKDTHEKECEMPSLAMVYSPYQSFESLFDYSSALCKGTIFRSLDKPFLSKGCGCR